MANEIRLSRRIAATPAEVFDAWTRAEDVNRWLIPCGPGSTFLPAASSLRICVKISGVRSS